MSKWTTIRIRKETKEQAESDKDESETWDDFRSNFKSNAKWWAEPKSNKQIAVGYTPSEVGDTQRPTLEQVKDDYVSGDIDIIQLENKLEEIIKREQ